jgi:hypothetical protein
MAGSGEIREEKDRTYAVADMEHIRTRERKRFVEGETVRRGE